MNSQEFYQILDKIQMLERVIYDLDDFEWMFKGIMGNKINELRDVLRNTRVENDVKV